MYRLFALLIGYAIGCIQTSYFVGRAHGIDIREHGSKSAGMTNVTRTVGKKWGAIVFLIDILKGVAAFVIATLVFDGMNWLIPDRCEPAPAYYDGEHALMCIHQIRNLLPGIYAGLGTVLGHSFPFWLKFRGGKGVASAIGLFVMVSPLMTGILAVIGVLAIVITRYMSPGSLIGTFFAPVVMVIFGTFQTEAIAGIAFTVAIIWILHRENIVRLITGKEKKFWVKKETPGT